MCGITGYINTDFRPVRNTDQILKMLKLQKHRGPDDSGIRLFSLLSASSAETSCLTPESIDADFEGVLGFNRLSILDLSMNGHQPMLNPDNNVIIALNGEIYNAFDFRNELQDWGYKFRSATDTEIVLALYLRHGFEGMLERLNGMFALIVIDLRSRELYLARDRFGIKPLYYILNDRVLAFSSELKSFAFLEDFEFTLNSTKLDEYLLFRNNLSGTLFEGLESLEPGHYLNYRSGQKLIKSRYYDVNDYSRSKRSGTFDSFGTEVREWLDKSVRSQLVSDVKLGCQLSGGIDSSLVTWLANTNAKNGSFESVSIVFKNKLFSEESYIDRVTETLGIKSHKFLLDNEYYLDNLGKATWHLESPLNHPNTVAVYKLSQRAKDYVTVLLSGEGADEVFGGYKRFYDIQYPFSVNRLLTELNRNLNNPSEVFRYFLDNRQRAIMSNAYMTPFLAGRLMRNFSRDRAISDRLALYNTLSGSGFDKQIKYEMKTFLPDLLIRQDKMSMAHSIENRVPFLDNEVVNGAFSIPEQFLMLRDRSIGKNTEKYLLKKMTAAVFGEDFAFRKKMGFGIPVKEFFSDEKFREYMNDQVLPGIRHRGLFSYKLVSGWFENIKTLKYTEMEALWIVISFEIWAAIYLDKCYVNSYT
ncbi:MAG: asparagine synthase (glutamine-hydrolyzing) [Bacteroidales bacterium]|jgi:asparagine synthase (glutamine-hydrolysing)|nr:asparagine synthase (glutamine-hydrolyzing) [Bacteroidales bacterium]